MHAVVQQRSIHQCITQCGLYECYCVAEILDEGSSDSGEEGDDSDDDDDEDEDEAEVEGNMREGAAPGS